ncbi:hypothetical protein RFI_24241 [Reticulomyxa filosa]|uniref:Ankyrin repeat-containing protein n=1 Tax=Reticulomyxa filosa TaxID=46433 RepID=X6MHH7_RETFI|nr:hypothetical protein RFI_24241 [Reticulomyxa filosa]|eukprot:ETO13131.1 hypothetical protein RFI_24241 [Reticulomyxa filosa]
MNIRHTLEKKPVNAERIELFAEQYNKLQSKSDVFLYYLKEVVKKSKRKVSEEDVMETLSETIQELIKRRMPLLNELLFLTLWYERDINAKHKHNNEKEEKRSTRQQQQQQQQQQQRSECLLINASTVSPKTASDPPPKLYEVIKDYAESESKRGLEVGDAQIRTVMSKSKNEWEELTKLSYQNARYKSEVSCRQDKIKHGVKPGINASQLEYIDTFCQDSTFKSSDTYDYNIYLSELITRAHLLNNSFQEVMQAVYSDDPDRVKFGPVKSMRRCVEKAQIEYPRHKFAWPTGAQIIDVVRCALTYEDVSDYLRAIRKLLTFVGSSANLSSEEVRLEVMRVKNGFAQYLNVPFDKVEFDKYTDVKVNIVLNKKEKNNKWIGVVGEVQFILKPMSDLKSKIHKLYEIVRSNDFYKEVDTLAQERSMKYQFRLSGVDDQKLSLLMTNYPIHFMENRNDILFERRTLTTGETLLHELVVLEKPDLWERLMELAMCNPKVSAGKLWTVKNNINRTPFHFLAMIPNPKTVSMWLSTIPVEMFGDIWVIPEEEKKTPFHYVAVYQRSAAVAKLFVDTIPDGMLPTLWTIKDQQGSTAAHDLMRSDSPELIHYMLSTIPTQMIDEMLLWEDNFQTVFTSIATFHPKEAVEILVNKASSSAIRKAWVHPDREGRTALHFLTQNTADEGTALMLKALPRDMAESLWGTQCSNGDTPLHELVYFQGSYDGLELLLGSIPTSSIHRLLMVTNAANRTPMEGVFLQDEEEMRTFCRLWLWLFRQTQDVDNEQQEKQQFEQAIHKPWLAEAANQKGVADVNKCLFWYAKMVEWYQTGVIRKPRKNQANSKS